MSGFLRFLSLVSVAAITGCATVSQPSAESSGYVSAESGKPDSLVDSGSSEDSNYCPPSDDLSISAGIALKAAAKNIPIFIDDSAAKVAQNYVKEKQPASDPKLSVWDVLQSKLSLYYDSDNPRITQERKRYTKHPGYLGKVTERAEPYLFHIIKSLNDASLPLELVALPIVESAYKSTAKSRHGAEGLWQFIRSTGKNYGLKRDWWYDGRRDPLSATEAAIAYLKHLNKMYEGDWLLSLAAYNAGENAVNRAIQKNRKRGLPEDYWNLQLPKETMKYVPRFLAVVSILENPDVYGVKLHTVKHSGYFEPVSVAGRTSLTKLAKQLNLEPDLVLAMNAGHRRGVTPPDKKSKVLLPQDAAAHYETVQSDIADKIEIAAMTHKVRKGETLSHISRHYGIPIVKIRANNEISGNLIKPGQKLQIPES